MKKMDDNFRGTRGSLPPQLFKYIDQTNMADETARFTEYINSLSGDFLDRFSEMKQRNIASQKKQTTPIVDDATNDDNAVRAAAGDFWQTVRVAAGDFWQNVHHVQPDDTFATIVPQTPKLFGQDVKLEYIGHGMVGNVYKMQIGDATFALKINREPNVITDLAAIEMHRHARNLINRPYIGATFQHHGETYSWILSDYVADGRDNDKSYANARDKVFYAAMTKGLKYSDLHFGNVKGGRIIDISGIERNNIRLSRIEVDMVKKFLYLMRTNDMPRFRQLAEIAVTRFPNVIKYMFVKMNIYQMEMPMQLQPFKKMLFDYNRRARAVFDAQSVSRNAQDEFR